MRQSKTLKICANHLGQFLFILSSLILFSIAFLFWLGFESLSYVFGFFFSVLPSMSVQEHAGNDKSCVWHAADFADGELKDELFCIRFASVESEFA